jgi:hypothetical protein
MMKKIIVLLAVSALVLAMAPAAQADPIPSTGFNKDWILDSSEAYATENTNEAPPVGYMWYAADSGVDTTTYPGFNSTGLQTVDGHDFQLSYTADNLLHLGTAYAGGESVDIGTLTLVTPGSFTEISVLGSSFNVSPAGTMTINFSDATDSGPIEIVFALWAGGGGPEFEPGLTNNGTTGALNGGMSTVTYDLAANGFDGKTVESITFVNTGLVAGHGVFGLSGVAGGGGGFDFDPDPADGSTVSIDRTDPMTWVLPDPNDSINGTVTCDVWFATDVQYTEYGDYPDDPNFLRDADQIVGGASSYVDVESVAIPVALAADQTYYWRIDTYDDSSLTLADQPVEGKVFTFKAIPAVDGCQAAKDAGSYTELMARERGDTNYDCKVNLVDLAAMALNWLSNASF